MLDLDWSPTELPLELHWQSIQLLRGPLTLSYASLGPLLDLYEAATRSPFDFLCDGHRLDLLDL